MLLFQEDVGIGSNKNVAKTISVQDHGSNFVKFFSKLGFLSQKSVESFDHSVNYGFLLYRNTNAPLVFLNLLIFICKVGLGKNVILAKFVFDIKRSIRNPFKDICY